MLPKVGLVAALLLATATQAWAVDLTVQVPPGYSPSSGYAPGADLYKQLQSKFEAANPDIHVNYEMLDPGSQGLQSLLTGASSNTLPDVAIVDGQHVPRVQQDRLIRPAQRVIESLARARAAELHDADVVVHRLDELEVAHLTKLFA